MLGEMTQTPIINIICKSEILYEIFVEQYSNIYRQMHEKGYETTTKFLQEKLGRQDYCMIGAWNVRYWVWEGEKCNVYSSKRGLEIEVDENLSIPDAWNCWKNFTKRLGENLGN